MTEKDTIQAVPAPITEDSLLADLRALGVRRGETLIVHSAMSKLGWVCGREAAVIRALIRAVGPFGTIVMPAHSGDNSEPSLWSNPPVPENWFPIVRATMPAYDRRVTATRAIGRVPETFRRYPGAKRSAHPHVSWAMRGPFAAWRLRGHTWNKPCFGPASPLGRLYRQNARTLLIGVGYGNCTALHLSEELCGTMPKTTVGAAVNVLGRRVWKSWQDIDKDSDRFPLIGEAYEAAGGVVTAGKVGAAECKLVPIAPLVDFATRWLRENPAPPEATPAPVAETPAPATQPATQAAEPSAPVPATPAESTAAIPKG